MSSNMYLVVEYTDTNELAVIPETWLDGNSCALWPPYNPNRCRIAAKKMEVPQDSWVSLPIKAPWYKTNSWDKACQKCKVIEETSNFESSDGENQPTKRRRRSPQRFRDESDSPTFIPRRISPPTEDSDTDVEENQAPLPFAPPKLSNIQTSLSSRTSTTEKRRTTPNATTASTPNRPSSTPPARTTPGAKSAACVSNTSQMLSPSTTSARTVNGQNQAKNVPGAAVGGGTASGVLRGESSNVSDAVLAKIFTCLEEIKAEQKRQRKALEQLMTHQAAASLDQEEEEDMFPLRSVEAVNALDRRLKDSKPLQTHAIKGMCVYGGKDTPDVVRRILKNVLLNDIAKMYSMSGRQKKLAFDELKLFSLLCKAVRCNDISKNATEKEIGLVAGKWFAQAADRDGGRKLREARKSAQMPDAATSDAATSDAATLNDEETSG